MSALPLCPGEVLRRLALVLLASLGGEADGCSDLLFEFGDDLLFDDG